MPLASSGRPSGTDAVSVVDSMQMLFGELSAGNETSSVGCPSVSSSSGC